MRIFLDDERFPPDDGREWIIVRTAHECIELLKSVGLKNVEYITFDHDLATGGTGYEVVCWIEEQVVMYGAPLPRWGIHSMNPVGETNMRAALQTMMTRRTFYQIVRSCDTPTSSPDLMSSDETS